jgi:hypothetical protein
MGIFGLRWQEVTVGWKQLHNEKLPRFQFYRTIFDDKMEKVVWHG